MEGVIKRGTGKKLRDLNLNLAGKTGTTNENTDTWFIGFTSNLVIGVYVGMDNPQPLGKFETGSKTALPIFKNFIKKAIKKSDARPFKVADGITMMVVDPATGKRAKFSSKDTILEVYKSENVIKEQIIQINKTNLNPAIMTVYITGNVVEPGQANLKKGTSLVQAIASNGGKKIMTGNVEFLRYLLKLSPILEALSSQQSALFYSDHSRQDQYILLIVSTHCIRQPQ